jgi:hypothetical protein
MRQIQLVGDVHGEFSRFQKLINSFKGLTIQLGDLGIGFIHKYVNPAFCIDPNAPYYLTKVTDFQCNREQMVFIRGNHDNVKMCRDHHNYLGEFGVFKDIFYVSGGWSIDRAWRKEGLDWWADEELSMEQSYKALEMYAQVKPEIVISHDCPSSILALIHSQVIETRTGQLLESMLKEHRPKQWYFAHHHKGWQGDIEGTHFRCLDCFETVRI